VSVSAIYTIDATQPFVECLFSGYFARGGTAPKAHKAHKAHGGGDAHESLHVFVPHKRGVRACYEGWYCHGMGEGGGGKKAVVLPHVTSLGDEAAAFEGEGHESLEEDGITIDDMEGIGGVGGRRMLSPFERSMRMASLVADVWREQKAGEALDAGQLYALTQEVGRFFDRLHVYGDGLNALEALIQSHDDIARHRRLSLDVLCESVRRWQHYCDTHGYIDMAVHKESKLVAYGESLASLAHKEGKDHPHIIIAGSTGTRPKVRAFMKSVLAHAGKGLRGSIILPAFDRHMTFSMRKALLRDKHEAHPQYGMVALLDALDAIEDDIPLWHEGTQDMVARQKAQRMWHLERCFDPRPPLNAPPSTSQTMAHETPAGQQRHARKTPLYGVHVFECRDDDEESSLIATLIRQSVSMEQSVALVTSNASLRMRVHAELKAWDMAVNDSAGRPFCDAPSIVFMRLLLDFLMERHMASLLAWLRHPLADVVAHVRAGKAGEDMLHRETRFQTRLVARFIDKAYRRGDTILNDVDETMLCRIIDESSGREDAKNTASDVIAYSWKALKPLMACMTAREVACCDIVRAHMACAEALSHRSLLWDEGRDNMFASHSLAFMRSFYSDAQHFPTIKGEDYRWLFEKIVATGPALRVPRLHVCGSLYGAWEMRMQSVSRVIIGSMNEGDWPPKHRHSIWLSPKQETALGFLTADQRKGLAAHDFLQSCGYDEVIMTRAKRVGDTPSVESSFLTRVRGFLPPSCPLAVSQEDGGGRAMTDGEGYDIRRVARAVVCGGEEKTHAIVRPTPKAILRCESLSVSAITMLRDNPYRFYARYILGLKPLNPLNKKGDHRAVGNIIHALCASFWERYRQMPFSSVEEGARFFIAEGEKRVMSQGYDPYFACQLRNRIEQIGFWFADEALRMEEEGIAFMAAEARGRLACGDTWIEAKADSLHEGDGGLTLVDYKTGSSPLKQDIHKQRDVQLTLEALIARAGGFDGIGQRAVADVRYMALKGKKRRVVPEAGGSRIMVEGKELDTLLEEVRPTLEACLAHYKGQTQPYHALFDKKGGGWRGAPSSYDPYAHMARFGTWGEADSDD